MQDRRTELYLVVDDAREQAERLRALLPIVRPASVLIRPAGPALTADTAAPLVRFVQAEGAAALLADDARLARTLKADGVHLDARDDILAAYAEAREILGSRGIVGADAGPLRHDAMSLGEAGADYIAFGVPDDATDRAGAEEKRAELVSWWAEIFEVPCVAFDASTAATADALAALGADFVAVKVQVGTAVAAEIERIAGIAAVLARRTETVR